MMDGSRCLEGHGVFAPVRDRCPACAGSTERVHVPDEGIVLASTAVAGSGVGVVEASPVVVPALVPPEAVPGDRVRLRVATDGRFTAVL